MADTPETEKKTLTIGAKTGGTLSAGKLTLGASTGAKPGGRAPAQTVSQSFSHGRSKTVVVEAKRQRGATPAEASAPSPRNNAPVAPATPARAPAGATSGRSGALRTLTAEEKEARLAALKGAGDRPASSASAHKPIMPTVVDYTPPTPKAAAPAAPAARESRDDARNRELEELRKIQGIEKQQAGEAEKQRQENVAAQRARDALREPTRSGAMRSMTGGFSGRDGNTGRGPASQSTDDQARADMARRAGDAAAAKLPASDTDSRFGPRRPLNDARPANTRRPGGAENQAWRPGRMNMDQAIQQGEGANRNRSLAAFKRRNDKFNRRNAGPAAEKVTRDVVIPETITVADLANRMTERATDVIKALMKMGVMATTSQPIDADTAELIVTEFGHRFKRVTEGDVELGLGGEADAPELLQTRAPIVTIMGHVDHGKTSLLDALRKTNVVAKEAGGITQHIGAYQVTQSSGPHKGQKVTFIDTPGHAAFTEMRARGANVTDIVILVVAANDGVMPQTIEAIKHARAAEVPMIIAINKIDLPGADASRVKTELLQYDIQVEDMGGDTLAVEVSAKTGAGLDKLLETILLQAEVMELKANPDRTGEGRIIEAKLDRGRGPVATVLVQRGTLKIGDIFVAGAEWGRIRALVNDLGQNVKEAPPAMPVEVLGASAVPGSGDDFVVVESEAKAREITDFRLRSRKDKEAAANLQARGSLADMMTAAAVSTKQLSLIIKGDVHGSIEAIKATLQKLTEDNTEVKVRVLDASVGAISESDINLAKASKGIVIGFNVRAGTQAREMARRDGVEIRYYSVIYNIIDDMRDILSGMLSPTVKENFIGYAEVLQVFNITKVGNVAGCRVTEGVVRRGAGVRLLRDDVVIHEGTLKTLKRVKDEVKEVGNGLECGMAFQNYENIQVGDKIECFELTEEARTLDA